MARRVRILSAEPMRDASGRAFLAFAVDAKYGFDPMDDEFLLEADADKVKKTAKERAEERWQKDAITGCLYPETNELFVNRSGTHYPAGLLLGKKASKAAEGVCRAEAAQVARK
jgi:hypothetical protein